MSEGAIGIGDVLWVEIYDHQFDDLICIPVRYAEPACHAIKKGVIRLVPAGDAGQINQGFIDRNRSLGASQFLNETLQQRWDMIKAWREDEK